MRPDRHLRRRPADRAGDHGPARRALRRGTSGSSRSASTCHDADRGRASPGRARAPCRASPPLDDGARPGDPWRRLDRRRTADPAEVRSAVLAAVAAEQPAADVDPGGRPVARGHLSPRGLGATGPGSPGPRQPNPARGAGMTATTTTADGAPTPAEGSAQPAERTRSIPRAGWMVIAPQGVRRPPAVGAVHRPACIVLGLAAAIPTVLRRGTIRERRVRA